MSRTLFLAANWKMHSAPEGTFDPESPYKIQDSVDVVVFSTFLDLAACLQVGIEAGPQYGHAEASGPHTGDVSLKMCADLGCTYALCGHSDRRQKHGETDDMVAAQVKAALALRLHPVVCIGEKEEERDAGKQQEVVRRQMSVLPLEQNITIAYEPIWAISRGDPNKPAASTQDAQEMHAFIRSLLPDATRETMRLLYGGSMKPENAKELLSQPDIDGGLIGGASLKPDAFREIITIAQSL
ncbi:triose-phosphate isomerase [Candidatus Peregrinibacteria bacterium CG10_big_fil_rev_8_21_14_0_10_49_10]|nr:MAG: triose-phosphate isomerase [Candidatus Peregrinibacteria bacterium CG10_big_fil_rev_8_21_14_0_10_49_10]